jgi:ABC-type transport system involved in multi-copper enzyme maturation permease subunit
MRSFISIALNAFMELVRQPIFLLLMTTSSGFCVFIAAVPYFGFGEDPKLVKDMSLALMLLSGLFGAGLCASSSGAQDLRLGTALTVLSKPVGRWTFLTAKYVGLSASLALMTYSNVIAALLAGRMAFDAYGDTDVRSLLIYGGSGAMAYAVAGFFNFFLRRGFVSDAVFTFILFTTLSVLGIHLFVHDERGDKQLASELFEQAAELAPMDLDVLASWAFFAMLDE